MSLVSASVDPPSLAKVLGVAKADAPDADQLDLFGEGVA